MLAIWFLVPLLFLKPAWTSGSSCFMYCWSLAWRILSITLLVCEWVQLCGILNILWHCLSLGLEWKLTFSSPEATAEFSEFAGILSAALSQHTGDTASGDTGTEQLRQLIHKLASFMLRAEHTQLNLELLLWTTHWGGHLEGPSFSILSSHGDRASSSSEMVSVIRVTEHLIPLIWVRNLFWKKPWNETCS